MKDMENENLKQLLEQNIKLNQDVLKSCQKIEKYMFHIKVYGVVKFLIIVIPIIIGTFYLIPIFRDFLGLYSGLLGTDVLEGMENIKKIGI